MAVLNQSNLIFESLALQRATLLADQRHSAAQLVSAHINITLRGSQVLMPRKLTNHSSADAIVGEFGDGAIAAALIGRIDW
jgi:hypothetical protein